MDREIPRNIRKGALGKGIGSLLGDIDIDKTKEATQQAINQGIINFVKPIDIQVNPRQPRKYFDETKLKELAQSISTDGVLQPLIVTKDPKSKGYLLVAGERRLRASKLAGLEEIPVIVKDLSDEEILRLALIENIQRADLNVIEEAVAIHTLITELKLTQEECAKRIGKDRSTISNTLRLLSLPKQIQEDVIDDKLSMGHARALLALKTEKDMLRARDIIAKNGLNVRQTEQLCKKVANDDQPLKKNMGEIAEAAVDPNLDYLAEKIRNHLRTKVKFSGNSNRGKIVISYFSVAELERLMELISS